MTQSYNFPLGVSKKDPNFEKILRIINGFRGYETLEDLKAADVQVRKFLAQQLEMAAGESVDVRKTIESGMHLRVLPDFDHMVRMIQADRDGLQDLFKDKISTCQVYRPAIDLVRDLYLLDFKILSGAENVYNLMQEFIRLAREDLMISNIHKINISLREIAECMEKRLETIECMIE
jgi:hypothetical protein